MGALQPSRQKSDSQFADVAIWGAQGDNQTKGTSSGIAKSRCLDTMAQILQELPCLPCSDLASSLQLAFQAPGAFAPLIEGSMMFSYQDAYLAGRSELASHCHRLITGHRHSWQALTHVFWENAWCDSDGQPQFLFRDQRHRRRLNVQAFDDARPLAVEKIAGFQRLRVTTNWVLPLWRYKSAEEWFAAMSAKNRKKLRWLRNAMPKEKVEILPLDDEAGFRHFETLFAAQFPQHRLHGEANQLLWRIYQELISQGKNFSWLMLDSQGQVAAASLGYCHAGACNFTHLTRQPGVLDKFSPGFYLVYWMIEKLYAFQQQVRNFFLGPGQYDYKPAFLALPLPVYRYERDSWFNALGLLRLHHRCRRERVFEPRG